MNYQLNQRLNIAFIAILGLTGCAPPIQKPIPIPPERKSLPEILSVLSLRSENISPLKATGQCRLHYYVERKLHRENFPLKLWVNPPAEIYLQGDVAFDPQGLIAGSNENEFWLALKPKEVSSYWWGQWSDENPLQKLIISPKIVLEALGIAQIGSEQNWSLSSYDIFGVLTKHGDNPRIIKRIYIDYADCLVQKIEYFDADGQVAIVVELRRYKKIAEDIFVPTSIKIINAAAGNNEDSAEITFGSIQTTNFTDKQRSRLFIRPQPRGFKNIYKIVNGDIIEQPQ